MVGKSLLLLLHVTCGYMFLTAQAAVHVHMYFKNPCFATGVCSRPECTNPTVKCLKPCVPFIPLCWALYQDFSVSDNYSFCFQSLIV